MGSGVSLERRVESEWLDDLPPTDPKAIASRRDLDRLNRIMGHARMIAEHLHSSFQSPAQRRLLEIGAGEGALMLRVARLLGPAWQRSTLVLLDKQVSSNDMVAAEFASLGWHAQFLQADVLELSRTELASEFHAILANLLLHHFSEHVLKGLLRALAARTSLFLAVEPRRTAGVLLASRLVSLLGCNAVTRHDAPVSVRAGFQGSELSKLWPASDEWRLTERPAGLFSHFFLAQRASMP